MTTYQGVPGGPRDPASECLIDGCARAQKARGWCPMHYHRWQRHGDPTIAAVRRRVYASLPILTRLMRRTVYEANGCLTWHGKRDAQGYGRIEVRTGPGEGRTAQTHRVAYEALVGPIPDGLQLDHLCRNTGCWRPDHLEPVTCRENLLRGNTFQARNASKTQCVNGHPFTDENTIKRKTGRGCRACQRKHLADHRARQRAAL